VPEPVRIEPAEQRLHLLLRAAAEAGSRVKWEIEPQDNGTCVLTVTYDKLEGPPKAAASVAGVGWMTVLSGLKTLLERGEPPA
jgi:hypothetical protein